MQRSVVTREKKLPNLSLF